MQALTAEQPLRSHAAGNHTTVETIALHLLPGLLTGAVYYLLAQPVANLGLPSVVALTAAGVLVILPFELGMIAWAGKNSQPEPRSFIEMVTYRDRMPLWKYVVLVPLLLTAAGLLFSLLSPLTQLLQAQFGWLPQAMVLDMGAAGSYSKATLLWVTIFNGLLVGLALPITEELYFRGFLLPRMPARRPIWAALANSLMFAAYHTWSPWMIPARAIGLLPLFYFVRRERNIYLGIIVHCLANLIDVVAMFALIAAMP